MFWKKKKDTAEEGIRSIQTPTLFHDRAIYTIPAWDLKVSTKQQYRKVTQERLAELYRRNNPVAQLYIRELIPQDLGLSSWKTPAQMAGQHSTWINHQLERGQFLAIYGLVLTEDNPKVEGLRIGFGTSGAVINGLHDLKRLTAVLPIINKLDSFRDDKGWLIESFGCLEDIKMEAFFSEPYIWKDEQVVWMGVTSQQNNIDGDSIVINGYIAEFPGQNIA